VSGQRGNIGRGAPRDLLSCDDPMGWRRIAVQNRANTASMARNAIAGLIADNFM